MLNRVSPDRPRGLPATSPLLEQSAVKKPLTPELVLPSPWARRGVEAPQQTVQPSLPRHLIEAFEHPDVVRPLGDGREEAVPVRMQRLNPATPSVDAGRSKGASIFSAPVFTSIA